MQIINETKPVPHGLPAPVGVDREGKEAAGVIGYYKNEPHHFCEVISGSVTLNKMDLTLTENRTPTKATTLKGRVAYLAAPAGSRNFFHWLIDMHGRSGIVGDLRDFDHVVINEPQHDYQKGTLKLLGKIPHTVFVSEGASVASDSIVVPSLRRTGNHNPARWMVEHLRSAFLAKAAKMATPNKIYISRRKRGLRNVINHEDIAFELALRGFREIFLEDHPFAEQIAILAQADVIVAPHGAGLSNTAFCKPGAKVIELFAPEFFGGLFWSIASHAGANYRFVIGRQLVDAPGHNANSKDMQIDWQDLETALAM